VRQCGNWRARRFGQQARDELGQAANDGFKESAVGIFRMARSGVVPVNCVIGEDAQVRHIPASRKILERADPDVACRNPSQDGAGQ